MSSAVSAVWYLLAHNAPLLAQVPVDGIVSGKVPQGKALPVISITHVVTTPRNPIAVPGTVLRRGRVQVTVMANSYPDKASILRLVRAALPRSPGVVASVKVDSILEDAEGPDFGDDRAGVEIGSQDFIVSFLE